MTSTHLSLLTAPCPPLLPVGGALLPRRGPTGPVGPTPADSPSARSRTAGGCSAVGEARVRAAARGRGPRPCGRGLWLVVLRLLRPGVPFDSLSSEQQRKRRALAWEA